MRILSILRMAVLGASFTALAVPHLWAQRSTGSAAPAPTLDQPDAERTKDDLSQLLDKYPPALRNVLALDPSLLSNQSYLTPYPALASFLAAHPDIARNPAFYINANNARPRGELMLDFWRDVAAGIAVVIGFSMAIGLIVWLVRTLIDYRRWNRLTKVQTDVHTKLVDRFTANEDLLAYIQSPAGAKFLESSPISLDVGPRSMAAPLGRILWSIQAGLVVAAAGVGFQIVSPSLEEAAQPLRALGILGVALGVGFIISALISYFISRRLGLIDATAARTPTTYVP